MWRRGLPILLVQGLGVLQNLPKSQAALLELIISEVKKEDTKKRKTKTQSARLSRQMAEKSKDNATSEAMRNKQLNLAETAVRSQEQNVAEITPWRKILLLSNRPGGADSEWAGNTSIKAKEGAASAGKDFEEGCRIYRQC